MNSEYRWRYDKSGKKSTCPACGKKTLVRYVETASGDYLPEQFGRCDREVNCGYWNKPSKFELSGYNYTTTSRDKQPKPKPKPEQVFIPVETLKETLNPERYNHNTFTDYLLRLAPYPFTVAQVQRVVELYYLGTTAEGFTTFPYIDSRGRVQAVQAVQFDSTNHRVSATFLHSLIEKDCKRNGTQPPSWLEAYNRNERKVACFYGEQLLNSYPSNPVALVEAPKTAIYSTLYFGFPDSPNSFLWLGTYNLSSLTADKCKVLEGRDVVLFPDLSKEGRAYKLWQQKAAQLSVSISASFTVSDFLEQNATAEQREKGLDLADFLIETDWNLYQSPPSVGSVVSVGEIIEKQNTAEPPLVSVGSVVSVDEIKISAPLSYSDRVFEYLHNLPGFGIYNHPQTSERVKGNEIDLSSIVQPENLDRFKEIVKFFIQVDWGRSWGYYIEFSNDYSKLKKFSY